METQEVGTTICDLCGEDASPCLIELESEGNASDLLLFNISVLKMVILEDLDSEQRMMHPIQLCNPCMVRELGKRVGRLRQALGMDYLT